MTADARSSSSQVLFALKDPTTVTMSDNGSPGQKPEDQGHIEHLNIKVTDNNNEVFFKIKRTTVLKKLMDAFCDRQGKSANSVRFLFDGQRVQATDSPESVSVNLLNIRRNYGLCGRRFLVQAINLARPLHETDTDSLSSWTCRMAIRSKFTRSRLVVARPRTLLGLANDFQNGHASRLGKWVPSSRPCPLLTTMATLATDAMI